MHAVSRFKQLLNSGVKNFKIPVQKELKTNPTLIVGDLFALNVSWSVSRLSIQVQGRQGRKNKLPLGTVVSPSSVTRERSLLTVNPDMGSTIANTVLDTGVTPGWCNQGVKAMNTSFLAVPHM